MVGHGPSHNLPLFRTKGAFESGGRQKDFDRGHGAGFEMVDWLIG